MNDTVLLVLLIYTFTMSGFGIWIGRARTRELERLSNYLERIASALEKKS